VIEDAPGFDALTDAEQATVDVVAALVRTGDVQALVAVWRDGGRERAEDALRTLAEWDAELLVQLALNAVGQQANGGRS
jgi:hypothetical protein